MKPRNKLAFAALYLAIGILIYVEIGCSMTKSIRPTTPIAATKSFDGNVQDSGLIKETPAGMVVTSRVRDRYNALVATYGQNPSFRPSLVQDQGVVVAPDSLQAKYRARGTVYVMDRETLVNFLMMNGWRKRDGSLPVTATPTPSPSPGIVQKVLKSVL